MRNANSAMPAATRAKATEAAERCMETAAKPNNISEVKLTN